ncbi:hypothetical protein [Arthrobacter sp. efr-133-R2A-120]|uniref:hypothetical protein n=1 Tax=Arthrobacter sp. efr-133-R2A-120 TaxID=3040277 RepID=UPI00254F20DC|nr:hypothetical protein [Arthrobacter sp. efr-133-R2A-120]
MLAGAGAVVWMALSSAAANADSGSTDNHTLLGGAGSSVSNVVHNAARDLSGTLGNADPAGVASVPAPAVHLPSVRVPAVRVPAVQVPARNVDQLVASAPVVSAVLPEGTVSGVTTPVVSPAASALDGVGSSVGSVVGRAVTRALGVVGSTVETLPGGSLPVIIPDIAITVPAIQFPDDVGIAEALSEGPTVLATAGGVLTTPAQDVAAQLLNLAGASGPPGLTGTPSKATVWASRTGDPSAPPSDGTFPPGTPGGSDTVGGSAVLSSNPSGAAAAWLQGTNLFYPLAGTLVSTAAAGRVPAPVSFDPGSSPD